MKLHHPLHSYASSFAPECIMRFVRTYHPFSSYPNVLSLSGQNERFCFIRTLFLFFRTDIL